MTDGFENEAKFLEMAIEGSLEAFNCLVTYYQTAVFNTALRILCDPARADDITQTAFINAWKHIGDFNGSSFKPWILRITINACYDELRRIKRHPEQDLIPQTQDGEEENEDVPWLIDPSESPVEQIERMDRQEAIKSCFEFLPDVYRTVFLLIDIHEMDYQTVADTLKIPLGTVKSRLLRARLRMRDCLKSKGNF
ncbi:MAG: sigma-70 family RNA polymerase sigma factor [Anaerolineaceae bacterium]|nr:sigma-70 family RNA polymerase sigma factor [Anaerolineaceae bacterium]